MRLSLIVAAAENGVIGRGNALPWHLPEDLKYFKRITMGKPIVMGRKTWESIGKPLPGRTNIVVSGNPEYRAEGAHVVVGLDAALRLAEEVGVIDGASELLVIGGATLYEQALPRADRLYLTRVHADVDGDTFLPEIKWKQWREHARDPFYANDANPYDYSFLSYERIAPSDAL